MTDAYTHHGYLVMQEDADAIIVSDTTCADLFTDGGDSGGLE